MAALTLSAGLVARGFTAAAADDPKPSPPAAPPAAAATPAGVTVKLELFIAGLGTNGCDVEIKPAHAACSFARINHHVPRDGKATITVNQVRTESADRDCSFAITIRETGQPPRTLYRGLRLKANASNAPQLLSCYLSSPSRVARIAGQAGTDTGSTTKR